MKQKFTALAIVASLVAGFGLTGTAVAAGVGGGARDVAVSQPASTVQTAQFRDHNRGRGDRREWRERRGDRDWRDRRDRRHYHRPPPPRGGIYFNWGPRDAPPPRYYEPPRQAYRLPASHVRWCQNRYRSYRAWDNSFQPYNGPRQMCRSPYL